MFSKGTPFSYFNGKQDVDDPYGSGVDSVRKRLKKKGTVSTGVPFPYSVVVNTQTADGGTEIYVATEDDPMVIVN
jgi:hypothetical protein